VFFIVVKLALLSMVFLKVIISGVLEPRTYGKLLLDLDDFSFVSLSFDFWGFWPGSLNSETLPTD
jgi:hypothetical protein